MTSAFTDLVRKNFFQNKELPAITNLYVSKKFTYLKYVKNNDNNDIIRPVTGISFVGFGKLNKRKSNG